MSQLPDLWKVVSLAELVRGDFPIMYGILQPGPHILDGVPYIRPTEIVDHIIHVSSLRRTSAEIASKYERSKLAAGDVLLSIVGTIGKVAIVPAELEGANITQSSVRIRADSPFVSNAFLSWFLRSPQATRQYKEHLLGTGVPRLNVAHVRDLQAPLAPVNEQRRIVGKIEALFERSRRARQALDAIPPLIEKLRQSILAAAFRGDLTAEWRAQNPDVEPAGCLLELIRTERRHRWEQAYLDKLKASGGRATDDRWKGKYEAPASAVTTDLPSLPASWTWARVEELATKVVDGVHKKPSYVPAGIPFLTVKNLTAGPGISFDEVKYITPRDHEEYTKRTDPELGDILISKDGTLGVTRLVTTDRVFSIFVSLALVKPVLRQMGRFLELAFQSPVFQERFVRTGSGLQHIHLRDLRDAVLPIAPLAEQVELARQVGAALDRVAAFENQFKNALQALPASEQAILAKAFRGELVPQDPEDEPASVLLERIRAARQEAPKRGRRARAPESTDAAPAEPPVKARPAPRAPATVPPAPKAPAKASAEPEPEPEPAPEPAQTTLPFGLAEQDPEAIQDALYAALWGRGPLEVDAAVRTVADALRAQGLVQYKKLRVDGPLYAEIKKAIDAAVRAGWLDRPRRGHVRAIEPDSRAYTTDDWRTALLAALDGEPVEREEAMRRAAEWARDNMGLAFQRLRAGGVVESGLKSAINSAIRRGELERLDAARIQRRT